MLSGIGPADHLRARRRAGRPRSAGCRPRSPGPSRVLLPGRLPRAGDAARRDAAAQHAPRSGCAGSCSTTVRRRARIWRPAASSARAAGVRHPDIQFHFLPALVEDHGRSKGRMHAYQAHAGTMRPASRGWLELRSADPREHPLIEPNYLAEEQDRIDLRACVRLTREIFAQPAFDRYRDRELQPGAEVTGDRDIDAFVRAKADSAYHPCCTCRMGSGRAGGGRPGMPGARARRAARGRRLDHAEHGLGQSQRADDHAGREGGRPDPRPAGSAARRRCRSGSIRTGAPGSGRVPSRARWRPRRTGLTSTDKPKWREGGPHERTPSRASPRPMLLVGTAVSGRAGQLQDGAVLGCRLDRHHRDDRPDLGRPGGPGLRADGRHPVGAGDLSEPEERRHRRLPRQLDADHGSRHRARSRRTAASRWCAPTSRVPSTRWRCRST